MQEYEKLLSLKKAYFTASGTPWKQQLKWADCCTPRRLLCLHGWRLPPYREFAFSPSSEHVSSAASVVEPLTRPNPALKDTDATPMEGNKIWVCISQSQVWPLPTIYPEISNVETWAWAAHTWKGFRKDSIGSSILFPFFNRFCHCRMDRSAISSLLHIHLVSSSQQGKICSNVIFPPHWKQV